MDHFQNHRLGVALAGAVVLDLCFRGFVGVGFHRLVFVRVLVGVVVLVAAIVLPGEARQGLNQLSVKVLVGVPFLVRVWLVPQLSTFCQGLHVSLYPVSLVAMNLKILGILLCASPFSHHEEWAWGWAPCFQEEVWSGCLCSYR